MARRIEAKPSDLKNPHEIYNMQMDNELVTKMSIEMREILQGMRDVGTSGWWSSYCSNGFLRSELNKHLDNQDYTKVALIASMLRYREMVNIERG